MTALARRLVPVDPAPVSAVVSCGEGGGAGSGVSFGASRFDPHAFRRVFPDRWAAFLRAHHRDYIEVAYFYGVTERAARDWWEGVSGPRGAPVAVAALHHPEGFARIVLRAA